MSETTRYKEYTFFKTRDNFVKIRKGDEFDGLLLPLEVVKGLTALEIVSLKDDLKVRYDWIVARVEELKAEFPGITFGYLGNFYPGYTDITYYIFLPHPGRVGTWKDQVGGYRYWNLSRWTDSWDQTVEAVRRGMVGREVVVA